MAIRLIPFRSIVADTPELARHWTDTAVRLFSAIVAMTTHIVQNSGGRLARHRGRRWRVRGLVVAGVSVAALALAGPASAAGMYWPSTAAPLGLWSWTGLYAGLNAGAGWTFDSGL